MSRPSQGGASYRAVLALPRARSLFAAAMLARLSYGFAPLPLLLALKQGTHSYAVAGLASGLFGLVTYAAEQRMKEIGIRKVLGARVSGIVGLLSKDFALLVGIAALIAFPFAWWGMSKWLNSFAYRIGISWWIFVAAGAVALLIALLTVSLQTIRAALANPVKSLRSE